jgi:Ni/Fe-hydrogenase 1 B-type cytochrome subunit
MLKRVYVWEFPIRLVHFFNFWTIGILCVTGFYIGTPFIHAVSEDESVMATARLIHFITAYAFTANFAIRVYWIFAGNRYASWKGLLPLSKKRWKDLLDTALFYAFLRKETTHPVGHSGLASLTYLGLFCLFLTEILTGFALYSQSHVGKVWMWFGGWIFLFISSGIVRLYHHLIMWPIVIFVMLHFYIAWADDVRERVGSKSSIFSGYKTVEEE